MNKLGILDHVLTRYKTCLSILTNLNGFSKNNSIFEPYTKLKGGRGVNKCSIVFFNEGLCF